MSWVQSLFTIKSQNACRVSCTYIIFNIMLQFAVNLCSRCVMPFISLAVCHLRIVCNCLFFVVLSFFFVVLSFFFVVLSFCFFKFSLKKSSVLKFGIIFILWECELCFPCKIMTCHIISKNFTHIITSFFSFLLF